MRERFDELDQAVTKLQPKISFFAGASQVVVCLARLLTSMMERIEALERAQKNG